MQRRGFLKLFGLGAAAAVTSKVEAVTSTQLTTDKIVDEVDGLADAQDPAPYPFCGHKYGSGTLTNYDDCELNQSGTIPNGNALSEILEGNGGDIDLIWGPEIEFTGPAFKADRTIENDNISYFMSECADRGTIVSCKNEHEVHRQRAFENPIGVLLNDVVDIDMVRQPIGYYHNDEAKAMLGDRVSIVTKGKLIMCVDGRAVAGEAAWSYNGNVNSHGGIRIGTFLSSSDDEGFAKVQIDMTLKYQQLSTTRTPDRRVPRKYG
jgi:hypothetical protein